MITVDMTNKATAVTVTNEHFSTENNILTLEVMLMDGDSAYDLSGKVVTVTFQGKTMSAPLTVTDGNIILPITSDMISSGWNFFQFAINWEDKQELTPKFKWNVLSPIVSGADVGQVDILSSLIQQVLGIQNAEDVRLVSEQERIDAEELRLSAEISRGTAEGLRETAENTRSGFYSGFNTQLAQKVGGGKLASLNDFDEETINFIHDGTGGPIQIESVPKDNSVSPEKTTFFEPPKNLFSGEYVSGGLKVAGSVMNYSLINTLKESIAIIPINANETYTVKIHDFGLSDKLNIGILNAEPAQAASYREVDTLVFNSFSEKVHTFTNTSAGRYLLISVSSNGLKPRLQVEQGTEATEYSTHPKIYDKYINFKDDNLGVTDYEAERKSLGISTEPSEKAQVIPIFKGDDTDIIVSGGVLTYDEIYNKQEATGLRLSVNGGSGTPYLQKNTNDNRLVNIQSIAAWIFIEDVSKTTSLFLQILDEFNREVLYNTQLLYNNGIELINGWNLIRWRPGVSTYPIDFGKITRARVMIKASEPTFIVVGDLWAEKFEKAKLLFIHDGGYSDFFQKDGRGYEDLKARGIPCTIASIPKKTEDPTNDRFISKSKLYELSMENDNDISIHSYNSQNEIATMSPEELKEESYNAIELLKNWGYNPLWRAAWFRNNAPSAMGSTGLFHAFAFSSAFSVIEYIESFPFQNPYNVSRIQLHGRERADIDRHFGVLKSTKGVMVAYTHSVADDSSGDISVADWDYFLGKVDEGLNEGWLEGTTFKRLIKPYN